MLVFLKYQYLNNLIFRVAIYIYTQMLSHLLTHSFVVYIVYIK